MINPEKVDTIIIGAGLAGLACARELHASGSSYVICEAADRVGGRVATDLHEGYRLDRGFQVLLTAYPEARRLLDYAALDLRRFYPGAMVRHGGKWHRVADPFRHPIDGLSGVFNPVGTFADKLRVGWLRLGGFDFSRHADSCSTLQALKSEGFSESMIDRFFRPFLNGVFLENQLSTSVRKLEFVMKHFARGDTAIPALGMAEIPQQLAAPLDPASIRLNTRVESIGENGIRLANGEFLAARNIVVATEAPAANQLLDITSPPTISNAATCLYFTTASAPSNEPILFLNGENDGPVNHLVVLSAVSPAYAPAGQHLISVNVVDPVAAAAPDLEQRVSQQVAGWFGDAVAGWRLLRVDRIPHAVPAQQVIEEKSVRVRKGIYQCGDHCGVASIDTALASGSAAARAILEDRT